MQQETQQTQYIIGVDIGGTNTDSVLLKLDNGTRTIISKSKQLTSPHNVTEGVMQCIKNLNIDQSITISFVVIGTTHFINEIIQKSPGPEKLSRIANIRLCGSLSYDFESFGYIDNDLLLQRIKGPVFYCNGGIARSIMDQTQKILYEVKKEEILECIEEIIKSDIHNISITGIGSLISNNQELEVDQIIQEFCKEKNYTISTTLSHTVCQREGLLYRENATILNETLKYLAFTTFEQIQNALTQYGLKQTPILFSKNDGSFMTPEVLQKYPILTCSASIVNSLKGGASLYHVTENENGLIVDIGGTSTDLAILYKGVARESGKHVTLGGVSFNSERMPSVSTIAMGGGSIVKVFRDSQNQPKLELLNQSIAKQIKQLSVCCNEYKPNELLPCNSDFSQQYIDYLQQSLDSDKNRLHQFLKSGKYTLEGKEYTNDFNDNEIQQLIEMHKQLLTEKLFDFVEQAFNGQDKTTVYLCGGGANIFSIQLLQERIKKAGLDANLHIADNIDRDNVGFANAMGATQYKLTKYKEIKGRSLQPDEYLDEQKTQIDWKKVIQKEREILYQEFKQLKIVEEPFEDLETDFGLTPYGLNGQVDIRLKISGKPIDSAIAEQIKQTGTFKNTDINFQIITPSQDQSNKTYQTFFKSTKLDVKCLENKQERYQNNIEKYGTPNLVLKTPLDFKKVSWGAGLFGCGGGGSCESGEYLLIKQFEQNKQPIYIYNIDNLPEGEEVTTLGFFGLPSVLLDIQLSVAIILKTFEQAIKVNPKLVGLMDIELGGTNALVPLLASQLSGYPVFDCHLMDRAYPRISQASITGYAQSGAPMVFGGMLGDLSVVEKQQEKEDQLQDFNKNFDGENVTIDHHPYQMDLIMKLLQYNGLTPITIGHIDKQNGQKTCYLNSYQLAYQVGDMMHNKINIQKQSVIETLEKDLSQVFINANPQSRPVKVLGSGRIISKFADKKPSGQDIGYFEISTKQNNQTIILKVNFQNEYLVVRKTINGESEKVIATVPDMISLADLHTGNPIHSEETRIGLEVVLFVMPASNKALQPELIKYTQPKAFGEDCDYTDYNQQI